MDPLTCFSITPAMVKSVELDHFSSRVGMCDLEGEARITLLDGRSEMVYLHRDVFSILLNDIPSHLISSAELPKSYTCATDAKMTNMIINPTAEKILSTLFWYYIGRD